MSINLFPSDFLLPGIVDMFVSLHREDSDAFSLLHVELLEHEEASRPDIIAAILNVHKETGLLLAKDDVGPETFADPEKRSALIELCRSLEGVLVTLKLDSSLVCGAMNVPLVPRSFTRTKASFDNEVPAKRRYREAWSPGMNDDQRQFKFPLALLDSDHFTTKSVVRTYANKQEAISHAADVVHGFLLVSQALEYQVDMVAEASIYASDFARRLDHPVFGPFTRALLRYACKGKLFIQGSMCGGRAVSDAIVTKLVTHKVTDEDGAMKALLVDRQSSSSAGADESYHISEDLGVYKDYGDIVARAQAAAAEVSGGRRDCTGCFAGLIGPK